MKPGPFSLRAIIFAPNGRDAALAQQILREAGFPADVVQDLPALCAAFEEGAGLAVIAEEAIADADLRPLAASLRQQPPWSDFASIVLTRRSGGTERTPAAARLGEMLGNVTFLERPFHPTTLVSMVSTAVRSRRRQYDARARLEELSRERAALAELTDTLEQRVRDRTAELLAESQARERAQEQLLQSQKMDTLGQLTGGVAHDFNNLLMAVLANLELLQKRFSKDAHARRLVEGAIQGAQRGAALTQRMLAFARQQELKTSSTDLRALLGEMREMLARTLGPQITLCIEAPEDLPPAQVDANQIELAILNLVINSRDAMPRGGTITIRASSAGAPGAPAGEAYVSVQVTDTGSGMDPQTLARAVEPFFSTKPLGKGTGLGLSMVHGLAAQLGGSLDLRSRPGEGTQATLCLPMATTPPVEAEAPAVSESATRSATILVVDDDPLIAMSTVDMLEDLGHVAIEAHSGRRALEIIEAGQVVDLLLTDQVMPGMTGLELAAIVRTKLPAVPVLLATGYADMQPGTVADLPHLSKPYRQRQLQDAIQRLLG